MRLMKTDTTSLSQPCMMMLKAEVVILSRQITSASSLCATRQANLTPWKTLTSMNLKQSALPLNKRSKTWQSSTCNRRRSKVRGLPKCSDESSNMGRSSKKRRFSTELRKHEEAPIAQISARTMRQDLSASVKNQRKEPDLMTRKRMIFKTKIPHQLVAAQESTVLV